MICVASHYSQGSLDRFQEAICTILIGSKGLMYSSRTVFVCTKTATKQHVAWMPQWELLPPHSITLMNQISFVLSTWVSQACSKGEIGKEAA